MLLINEKAAAFWGSRQSGIALILLLSLSYGYLSELLEILHKIKSSLTGTGTSSLVSLFNLSIGIHYEYIDLFLDLCYKLFHCFIKY